MNNIIIIGLYVLAIVAILCFTIYKIKIINSPELPKRMHWMNYDIVEIKKEIKDIKNDIKIIKEHINNE